MRFLDKPQRNTICVCLYMTMAFTVLELPAAQSLSRYVRTQQPGATITIDADRSASFRIPRTVYGTFLEDIGNSTFGGVSAQLLDNPSLETYPASLETLLKRFSSQQFVQSSHMGLPLPWLPLRNEDGWRYESRWGNAANSHQYLYVMGRPDQEVGIRQSVYLPVERELNYTGVFFSMSAASPAQIKVSFRAHDNPDHVLASTQLNVPQGSSWNKYHFRLAIPEGTVPPLGAVDFAVSIEGDVRISLDEIRLYPADAIDRMDPDVIRMAKQLNSPLLRFGGNFTSGYHWRDGIGPVDQRPTMLNQSWGIPEYNEFGTDELMDFCSRIGAQAQICLNLGSGTPGEARDWVEYCQGGPATKEGARRAANGHPNPYPVAAWELGNELWGHFQIGWQTPETYASRYTTFYKAIRHLVPPATMIFANGADVDFYKDWNGALIRGDGGELNYLTSHFVVGMDRIVKKNADRDSILAADFSVPVGVANALELLRNQIDANPATRDRVKVAYTEWLFTSPEGSGLPRWDNQGGAVLGAAWMNMILSHADFVPVSDMTGLLEFAGIQKDKGRVYGTPQYWAFDLYSNHAGDQVIATETRVREYDVHEGLTRVPEINDVPYLDVLATRSTSDGSMTMFTVNRDWQNAISTQVNLEHFSPTQEVEVETLAGDNLTAMNDAEHPEAVHPVQTKLSIGGKGFQYRFPPLSVTMFTFHSQKHQ